MIRVMQPDYLPYGVVPQYPEVFFQVSGRDDNLGKKKLKVMICIPGHLRVLPSSPTLCVRFVGEGGGGHALKEYLP